jgi:1-acyl-sn-glycerol-3-phosphate acyltransferase
MSSLLGLIVSKLKPVLYISVASYVMCSHVLIMIFNHLLITILFYYISPWIYHKSLRLSAVSCSGLCLTLAHWCFPSRYVLTFENEETFELFKSCLDKGDLVSNDIVISNHQLYTDWIYIWGLFTWMGKGGNIKITLKKSLQMIPVIGLGMKLCGFIFISRKWNVDHAKFIRRIARLANFKPFSLLIFPEGNKGSL